MTNLDDVLVGNHIYKRLHTKLVVQNNYKTVEDIVSTPVINILNVPQIGLKTFWMLTELLAKYNYHLTFNDDNELIWYEGEGPDNYIDYLEDDYIGEYVCSNINEYHKRKKSKRK